MPNCPICGQPALRSKGRWGVRYDHCGLWAWGDHPLVDGATHKARRAAHVAFDQTWSSDLISTPREIQQRRSVAYRQLAELMGMSPKDCHIKQMNQQQAEKVISVISDLRASWRLSE